MALHIVSASTTWASTHGRGKWVSAKVETQRKARSQRTEQLSLAWYHTQAGQGRRWSITQHTVLVSFQDTATLGYQVEPEPGMDSPCLPKLALGMKHTPRPVSNMSTSQCWPALTCWPCHTCITKTSTQRSVFVCLSSGFKSKLLQSNTGQREATRPWTGLPSSGSWPAVHKAFQKM